MRRRLALTLLLILATTALVRAQEPTPDPQPAVEPAEPVPVTLPPDGGWRQMIRGAWQPLDLEPTPPPTPFSPFSPESVPATDSCAAAPVLNLAQPGGDGGQTIVNSYSESLADPVLACVWGTPTSPTGWRTAWYKFTAPSGGVAVVETVPNADYRDNYDTVLAVYTGNCGALVVNACSDDRSGFLSRVEVPVQAGKTYYVEVADWQLAVNGLAKLNVIAYMTQNENLWQDVTSLPLARSRHTVEVYEDEIYAVGGQTVVGGTPVRTPSVQKYNPATDTWTDLASMLGPDNQGYSNADSALVNGVIYLPSGWVGDNDNYDGTHWQYDIADDQWSEAIPAPWITPTMPVGYAAVVAAPNVTGYYFIGGLLGEPFSASAMPQNRVIRFRQGFGTLNDQWFTTPPPLTVARYLHTGVQVTNPPNWICVAGGITFGNLLASNGECYTSEGTWRTIAGLNPPRFGAQSVIGPDGRWYVIGGRDATFQIVEEIAVFNPPNAGDPGDLGSWTTLDARFNIDQPVRTWTPGGSVGNSLFILGGETSADQVVPLVERLFFPPVLNAWRGYFPFIPGNYNAATAIDDTFANARLLIEDFWAFDGFTAPGDLFDVFALDVSTEGDYIIDLQGIPDTADYDLFLYGSNKFELGASTNVGNNNERIVRFLGPGRYYAMVVRAFPTGDPPNANYQIRFTR